MVLSKLLMNLKVQLICFRWNKEKYIFLYRQTLFWCNNERTNIWYFLLAWNIKLKYRSFILEVFASGSQQCTFVQVTGEKDVKLCVTNYNIIYVMKTGRIQQIHYHSNSLHFKSYFKFTLVTQFLHCFVLFKWINWILIKSFLSCILQISAISLHFFSLIDYRFLSVYLTSQVMKWFQYRKIECHSNQTFRKYRHYTINDFCVMASFLTEHSMKDRNNFIQSFSNHSLFSEFWTLCLHFLIFYFHQILLELSNLLNLLEYFFSSPSFLL